MPDAYRRFWDSGLDLGSSGPRSKPPSSSQSLETTQQTTDLNLPLSNESKSRMYKSERTKWSSEADHTSE